MRTKAFLFGFSLLSLTIAFTFWFETSGDLEAQEDSGDTYSEIGKRSGVFNDGQAALWDLNITDHFHYFGPEERARGYAPEQPIKFSHVTHVQKNDIECQFCHWNVAKSPYAAIPEMETCWGCHKIIKGQTEEQQAEIKKLESYFKFPDDHPDASKRGKEKTTEEMDPIPWEKVHVMPDHVRFNHKRHVKAGVGCQECHGQIPEMEVVERVSSMKMGWCVDCHRQKGTSIDCYVCHK